MGVGDHASGDRSRRASRAAAAAFATLIALLAAGSSARADMLIQPFTQTGEHQFTVPTTGGVDGVWVGAEGGNGGEGNFDGTPALGGQGTFASADVPVTPGEKLYAEIASDGTGGSGTGGLQGGTGGANGGGNGGMGSATVSSDGTG